MQTSKASAVKEVKELLDVKEGKANAAVLNQYAASRAAAINQHARCQQCEACLTSTVSPYLQSDL